MTNAVEEIVQTPRRDPRDSVGVESQSPHIARKFPLDRRHCIGEFRDTGDAIGRQWLYGHCGQRTNERSERLALLGVGVGRDAVESNHEVPTSVVSQIAAGAKRSVASGLAVGVLQPPYLRMEQHVGARRLGRM